MPAATLTDVINQALDRLGIATIGTLGSDGTPQDGFMNRNHLSIIQGVMRLHDWPSLKTRKLLDYGPGTLTLSSTAVGTGITATSSVDFFTARDVGAGLQELGSGATGVSEITGFTNATVVTIETTTAWADADGIVPQNSWTLIPQGGDFSYAYVLPSDSLVIRNLNDRERLWAVEGTRILASYADAVAHYIRYISTPDDWDRLLLETIVAKLAAEAAWPLTKNTKLQTDMVNLFELKKAEAMGVALIERKTHQSYSLTTLRDVR